MMSESSLGSNYMNSTALVLRLALSWAALLVHSALIALMLMGHPERAADPDLNNTDGLEIMKQLVLQLV